MCSIQVLFVAEGVRRKTTLLNRFRFPSPHPPQPSGSVPVDLDLGDLHEVSAQIGLIVACQLTGDDADEACLLVAIQLNEAADALCLGVVVDGVDRLPGVAVRGDLDLVGGGEIAAVLARVDMDFIDGIGRAQIHTAPAGIGLALSLGYTI